MSFCTKCGKQNPDTAKFCTGCGATLTPITATSEPSQPVPPQVVSKNKNNWIVIAIVVILGLGIGAYFVFFNKKSGKEEVQKETESNQTIPGSYPYASQRLLTDEDVRNLSQYNLRIMRNEIYARHGFIFQNTEMKNYFSTQPWYSPLNNDVNGILSVIEKKNIEFIKRYERFVGD